MSENKDFINIIFDRIEKMISNKTIFGDPIKIYEITIIPILKMNFSFGTGNIEKLENQKDLVSNGFFGDISLNSIAFLIINDSRIQIINTNDNNNTRFIFDKIIDLLNLAKSNYQNNNTVDKNDK